MIYDETLTGHHFCLKGLLPQCFLVTVDLCLCVCLCVCVCVCELTAFAAAFQKNCNAIQQFFVIITSEGPQKA